MLFLPLGLPLLIATTSPSCVNALCRYCSPGCQEVTRERHLAQCGLLREEREDRERREAVACWTFNHVMPFEQY